LEVTTVKAVVYDAPRSFRVRDIPAPEPRPGEVLIKIIQTGLCGTDLHIHEGDFYAAFPLIPGHEIVGTIAGVGDGVTDFTEGDRVTVNPNISCGNCHSCRSGRPLLCRNLKGVGTNWPGGFAEYMTAPAAYTYSVDGIPDDTAVATEPAACAMHGLETLQVKPGSTALVFGAGPTGLLLSQLLVHGGAAHVTVAASTAFKLERAKALGIDNTYLMDRSNLAGDVAALQAASDGGYDVVVDATGAASVTETTVGLTRDGGTVMIYGVTGPEDTIKIHPYDIFRREITIKGSFAEINSFPATIEALRSGRISTNGLITHRYSIDDYAAALQAFRDDKTVHKIIITA
jgi:D-arabinitol dehydrogenase (NADP+)